MPAAPAETASRILDVAEHMVQTRGFNGFSYADVAGALHVTKASLHYHFPTKATLGERLIERYLMSFLIALDRIDGHGGKAGAKLRAYAGIYADMLGNGRMCLCGMLAAEHTTLPPAMQDGVRHFFEINEAWLVGVILRGRETAQLAFAGSPVEAARTLVAALQGAMLLARSQEDPSRLRSAVNRVLLILVLPRLCPWKRLFHRGEDRMLEGKARALPWTRQRPGAFGNHYFLRR